VAVAEARLFVGRHSELAELGAALAATRGGPQVVYVHGPAGVGKSALLRQFRRQAVGAGATVVLLDGTLLPRNPSGILAALADGLGCAGPEVPSSARVVNEANRQATTRPLVVAIDAYDQLQASDAWFRPQVLYGLEAKALVILAGNREPAELWALDPAWLATVQLLSLGELTAAEAAVYLRRCGVVDPDLIADATRVGHGRPLLLKLAASIALRHGRTPSGARGIAGLLLEELTREAEPAELHDALAAAALVRAFDRDLLAAMVGAQAAAAAWEALIALPVVIPTARRHALHESVRGHLAAAAARDRPWLVRRWRHRALEFYLRAEPGGAARLAFAPLAAHALWHPWLHPAAEAEEGWHIERGARGADAAELGRCLDTALQAISGWTPAEAARQGDTLRRLLREWPEGFTVLRGDALADRASPAADGTERSVQRILAWSAAVPLCEETRPALLLDAALGPYLEGLPPPTLAAWTGRSLAVCLLGVADPESEAHHVVVRELLGDFAPYDRVFAVAACARSEAFLLRLGFRRDPAFCGTLRASTRPSHALVLELTGPGYGDWLRGKLDLGGTACPAPEQRLDAAQEVLDALGDPERLRAVAAAEAFRRMFGTSPEPDLIRAWVVDALRELERADPLAGQLLSAYHVARVRPHEALAERLGLSQRTYYRRRRDALQEIARILFD